MKPNLICMLIMTSLLTACGAQEEMDEYVRQTKARPPVPIAPLPEVKPFSPMAYQQQKQRSPFVEPKPESLSRADTKLKANCAQIVANRDKEVLERYSLASLTMKGTIGKQGRLWALISTPDGQAIRVGLQQHMGLDQGRIVKITDTTVDLMETVPDGKGCWVVRETQLAMANLDAKH